MLLFGVLGLVACPEPAPRLRLDAGTPDAGAVSCVELARACGDEAPCCAPLTCDRLGACTDLPRCEQDDTLAGTVAAPVPIEDLGADDELVACREGLSGFDVFEIAVTGGDLLKLRLTPTGVPDGPVGGAIPDLDLWLYASLPTGAQDTADGGVIPFGGTRVSLAGVTTNAVEQVLYEVPSFATRPLYAVVVYYRGAALDAPYTLSFERRRTCARDADCGADAFCRVDYDDVFEQVLQQCDTWTPASCGAGADEAGGDVHAESDAPTLGAEQTGALCRADLDVFAFDKPEGDAAFVDLELVEADADFVAVYLVDPRGDLHAAASASPDRPHESFYVPASASAGRWGVWVDQLARGADDEETRYALRLARHAACRTDADCAAGEACGLSRALTGFASVCATPSGTACGETDGDDFASLAPLLASGAELSGSTCVGALDWARVSLPHLLSSVELELVATGDPPLALRVFREDGTALGAAVHGVTQQWTGRALPTGELHVVVDALDCGDPTPCTDVTDWTLRATVVADDPCASNLSCFFGGTFSRDGVFDPFVQLACADHETLAPPDGGPGPDGGPPDAGVVDAGLVDAGGEVVTTRACLRPAPIGNLSGGLGDACFDDLDCQKGLCFNEWCTMPCEADAECAALLEGGYCFLLSDPEVCAPPCDRGVDCWTAFEGGDDLVCSSENRCVP